MPEISHIREIHLEARRKQLTSREQAISRIENELMAMSQTNTMKFGTPQRSRTRDSKRRITRLTPNQQRFPMLIDK